MRKPSESSVTAKYSTRSASVSFTKGEKQIITTMCEFIEKKASLLQRICGRIWRSQYKKKTSERRAAYSEVYAELMAERDAKLLVVPDNRR